MNTLAAIIDRNFLHCHLKALIDLAGDKIPQGLKQHPNVDKLEVGDAVRLVDIYRSFLRSPRSLP